MGFFDSLKGVGRAGAGFLGGLISTGAQIFGPSLARAGVAAIERKIGGGGSGFNITPRARQVAEIRGAVARGVPSAVRPFPVAEASFAQLGFPSRTERGVPMGAFPVTRADFGVGTSGRGFFPEITERIGGFLGGQTTFFVQTPTRLRPQKDITQQNPSTGKIEFWRHMGRPVLFTGDLATVRRVSRVASRLNRRLGRRRPR